jgi:hypothetical protein
MAISWVGRGGGYFALLSPPTNEESIFRVYQGSRMFCDLVYLPKFGELDSKISIMKLLCWYNNWQLPRGCMCKGIIRV